MMTEWQWRLMEPQDMGAVVALSEQIHPDLPETAEVQSRRRDLYPKGCYVLDRDGQIDGYVFAHPIRPNTPPPLNRAPEAFGPEHSQLYLHDLVVSPATRGTGQARLGIEKILELGQDYQGVALISVYGTQDFWAHFGFAPAPTDPQKLASYGQGATFMTRAA